VKSQVRIPVIANGERTHAEEAKRVLAATGADGIMIGRAAQGRPWLFREIAHYLETGERLAAPGAAEMGAVLIEHLEGLYTLYGDGAGGPGRAQAHRLDGAPRAWRGGRCAAR